MFSLFLTPPLRASASPREIWVRRVTLACLVTFALLPVSLFAQQKKDEGAWQSLFDVRVGHLWKAICESLVTLL